MSPTSHILDGYMTLFRGRRDRYGTGKGWNKGLAFDSEAIELQTWRGAYAAHLNGEGSGLGVFPLLDDGTAHFGAIDLDEPDFGAAAQMQMFLPGASWLERSRSGNAHVWVFFERPLEAWIVRAILRTATEGIGKPRVEIFPKQDRLLEGMVGNFINLPYHGEQRPVLTGGEPLSLGAFVAGALDQRIDPATWVRRAHTLRAKPPEDRAGAAPGTHPVLHRCAEYMMRRDVAGDPLHMAQEGQKTVAVFTMAKMLRNYREFDEETGWQLLKMYNEEFVEPPQLSERELRRTFQNAARYSSTGCDEPLVSDLVDPDCPIASGRAAASA